jgi:NAD(P)-dependent dehydrogenase (short-subunit alcohol dehydrogenase family)
VDAAQGNIKTSGALAIPAFSIESFNFSLSFVLTFRQNLSPVSSPCRLLNSMSDSKRLAGKVAIVTGAAGGFGKGIAKAFVQQGASVIVVDRLPDAGQATATEIGAAFQAADVTKREDWERLLAKAIEQFGHVHIVVNNAGTTYTTKPTTTVSDHDFDLVFEVNVKSIYLSASVFIPYFLDHERHGSMINISSTSAVRPRPNLVWYGASKAAVSNATKALAIEYAQRQIRFNAVLPVVGITGLYVG